MLSGAHPFEISDIQEDEIARRVVRQIVVPSIKGISSIWRTLFGLGLQADDKSRSMDGNRKQSCFANGCKFLIHPLLGYGAPHLSARGTSTLLSNAPLSAHFRLADITGQSLPILRASRACALL